MSPKLLGPASALLATTLPSLAAASPPYGEPYTVALHVAAPDSVGACPDQLGICTDYRVKWPVGEEADVFMVVVGGDSATGIGGVSVGVCYDAGIQVQSWTQCSGLDFRYGQWPEPGSGITVLWNTFLECHRTVLGGAVHAVVGVFRVMAESPGFFFVTQHPSTREIRVFDCAERETPIQLYWVFVGFDEPYGYNPCLGPISDGPGCNPAPVVPETWGRLKALYGFPPP